MERHEQERFPEPHAKSLNPLERIVLGGYALHAQFPLQDHRIPLLANRYLFKLVLDISRGKTASQSPSELRYKLFPDYESRIEGVKNIPEKGSFIVVSNHYPLGPFKGSWQTAEMASAFWNNPPDNNRSFHSIIDSEKDSTGIFGERIKNEVKKAQSHILHNIANTLNYIPLDKMKDVLELLHHGQKGNHIIGIFPTGKAEFAFKTPASKNSGTLFEIAGKYDIPVLPMGIWHDKQKKVFIVRIGPATIYKRRPKDPNSKEQTAEKVMRSIACLLPHPMRGIYA